MVKNEKSRDRNFGNKNFGFKSNGAKKSGQFHSTFFGQSVLALFRQLLLLRSKLTLLDFIFSHTWPILKKIICCKFKLAKDKDWSLVTHCAKTGVLAF